MDQIEQLAKVISIPCKALTNGTVTEKSLISIANLAEEKQTSIPFVTDNSFDQTKFTNAIEAKIFIAKWLGYPLGRLLPAQIEQVNSIIAENLDKKFIMMQIKQLFKIKVLVSQEEN